MDRGASSAFLAELAKQKSQPFHLFELRLDSGTIYATDAARDIVWNGNTYPALSHLLDFGGIEETSELKVSTCSVSLSGVDQTLIAAVLGEDYINRRLLIYKGFLSENDGRSLAFDFTGATLTPTTGSATLAVTRSGATATRVNSAGLIETVAADTARFDYDPTTLAIKGLLIEEARTNICLRSQEIDNASWSKAKGSISANAVASPDGTTNADKFVEDGTNGQHVPFQSATIGANTSYTASAYLKAGGRTRVNFRFLNGTFSSGAVVCFDLSTGSVVSSQTQGTGSGLSYSITAIGNGWYRCTVTVVVDASSTTGVIAFYLVDTGTNDSYTGDSSSGLYIWGAQLEAGAFPTSYIPTTSAAVTRNADQPKIASLGSWFNATAGTLFTETLLGSGTPASGTTPAMVSLNDGTANNRIFQFRNSSNVVRNVVTVGGSAQANIALSTIAGSETTRVANSYRSNDFAAAEDGSLGTGDTAGSLPTVTEFDFGCDAGASGNYLNGHLRKVTYYPRDLPDDQLILLSAGTDLNDGVHRVVVDPIAIFDGYCDTPSISEDPTSGSCVVSIDAANQWGDERKPGRHTNHEEQQIYFSGDLFFQYVDQLNRQIVWGRPGGTPAENPQQGARFHIGGDSDLSSEDGNAGSIDVPASGGGFHFGGGGD